MIYGRALKVFVKKYLRAERKFSGLEELKAQLAIDKSIAQWEDGNTEQPEIK
jgi:riboflavin kinase/FMN adenylyltransferase